MAFFFIFVTNLLILYRGTLLVHTLLLEFLMNRNQMIKTSQYHFLPILSNTKAKA